MTASFLRELLRVVEQLVVVAGRQNDRRRINAARQASASCLIASRLYLSFKIMWFKHISLFYGLQSFYGLRRFYSLQRFYGLQRFHALQSFYGL